MIISKYFIKRKINDLACNRHRIRRFKSWSEVNRVMVFYHTAESETVVKCIDTLEKMGKTVFLCSYGSAVPENKEGNLHIQPQKDVSWWGYPQESVLKTLNDFKPDMLIDLTQKQCCVLQYLFLKCNCDFKTGIKKENQKLYDFAISMTESTDINYLFNQIIFYLQTIRSK